MKALLAAAVPLLVWLGVPGSARAIDESIPPTPVQPVEGASLPVRQSPLFRVRTQPADSYLWLHVSRSPLTDAKGVIGSDVELEPMSASATGSDLYDAQPLLFDYPGFWMNQPGPYYWQAYRISYANGADGAVEGPVQSITLTAPITPPPPPAPPPPTRPGGSGSTWLELFPDLSLAAIPRWVAGNRRLRGFVTSRAALPDEISRDRWLALVDTSAARWALRAKRSVSYSPDFGDYENQVGFSYDLPAKTLGSTVVSVLRRYRVRRICGSRGCRYRRRLVSVRTVDRDIVLNYWKHWQQGPAYPNRRQYDLQTVLIHEMGHLAGNGHRRQCINSPMVDGGLPGDWWRSPSDYLWVGCGSATAVSAEAGSDQALTARVIRAEVPAHASRAGSANELKLVLARAQDASRREVADD